MDIKHSTGELAIASVKGYIWFLCLNIIFAAWLVMRVFSGDTINFPRQHYLFLLCGIIIFSLINVFAALKLGDRISEGLYQKCLPVIVLIFSILWAVILFNMLNDFKQVTFTMIVLVIILLPATITFYISGLLLTLFCLPIFCALVYGELISPINFPLLSGLGMLIIMAVVLSARYILLESYERTQRSEYEKNVLIKKLVRLANFDTLTGLYNRHSLAEAFDHRVRQLESNRKLLFLIVLDIDFFKQYNDLYGHIEGDKCLIRASRCVEQSLRKTTDAAFRFGGEEFVVIAVCDRVTNAIDIAKRIQHALADAHIPHKGSSVSSHITMSQGIAQWHPGMTLEALLEVADKQLYQAKRDGRNRICWDKHN